MVYCINHRNIRTRRRTHICIQDDQIGQKIIWSTNNDVGELFFPAFKHATASYAIVAKSLGKTCF
jgi:hypothetical protein